MVSNELQRKTSRGLFLERQEDTMSDWSSILYVGQKIISVEPRSYVCKVQQASETRGEI